MSMNMMDLKQDFSRFARLEKSAGTEPSPWQRRILSELRFVLLLSEAAGGAYEALLQQAQEVLEKSLDAHGVITNEAAQEAEGHLLPCAEEAKSYEFLCVAHAHIDMNWQWGFHETVGVTVDTFRTMLQIMEEYPGFKFSQSQASVYRILEQYAPEMLEEVKARVKEGRWEVTASTWVETDKNMPSGESLSRQYLLAKRYLEKLFGLAPEDLPVDFEPDTFGHNANVPELAAHAGVKYYYHCRGRLTREIVSRWRAPSGAELLIFTEPVWYGSEINYHVAEDALAMEEATHSRTLLKVYGVGDHGGGPTRLDLDRLVEMDGWPVYPKFTFSTLRQYFETIDRQRENYPLVEGEINFLCDGCYTTQTRIKTGNRRSQRALASAELLAVQSSLRTGKAYPAQMLDDAWEKVLFNHFHDILPGSGVVETREYASALYQEIGAAAQTRSKQAVYELTQRMDTSHLLAEEDCSFSRGEGGGAGFDNCGRSAGLTRIYHVFQPSLWERTQTTEFLVWDYEGDESLLCVKTVDGQWIDTQLAESGGYWGHHFARLIANVTVPAGGWATYLVGQRPIEKAWNVKNNERFQYPDSFVLENDKVRAEFCSLDGSLISFVEKAHGREMIPAGEKASFVLATEGIHKGFLGGKPTMTAWFTGRQKAWEPLRNVELYMLPGGPVRQHLALTAEFGEASTLRAEICLDQGSEALDFRVTCDWHELGNPEKGVPCLLFNLPEDVSGKRYVYDVPCGFTEREGREMDLPALSFVMAGEKGGDALLLAAKEKYGYRCGNGRMAVTLIRASYDPDPIPEIGKNEFSFAVIHQPGGRELAHYARVVQDYENPMKTFSGRVHGGDLPLESPFMQLETGTVLVSAVKGGEDARPGEVFVRLFNTAGKPCEAVLRCAFPVEDAFCVDILERPEEGVVSHTDTEVQVAMKPYGLTTVKIRAKI